MIEENTTYKKRGNINASEERALSLFYKDVERCKKLSKKNSITHLKKLRALDYDMWDIIFGEDPVFLQYLVTIEIPEYVREHVARFYYKAVFDKGITQRLEALVIKYQDQQHSWGSVEDKEEYHRIKQYFSKDFTVRLDGGRLLRDHLLDVLRGIITLRSYSLPSNIDYKCRVLQIEAYAKEQRRLQDLIFNSTVRLAIKLSASYYKRFKHDLRLSYSDVLQHTSIGLLQSIKRYDPDNGASFSTYATQWMSNVLQQAVIETNYLVHCPANVTLAYRAINQFTDRFLKAHNRSPTDEETLEGLKTKRGVNKAILKRCKSAPFFISSLNKEVSSQKDGYDDTRKDVTRQDIVVGSFPNPDTIYNYRRIMSTIERHIKSLPQPERGYIQEYYVKGGYTWASLGAVHNTTGPKMRHKLLRGLQELRNSFEKEGWEKEEVFRVLHTVYEKKTSLEIEIAY